MTTIEIKTLSELARKPTRVPGRREYFQLYASGNYEIAPGKTKTIDTALQVRVPPGFDIDIVDDELSMSRGLMINRYPGLGETAPYVDGEIPRLSYMVHNTSQTHTTVRTGDAFGQFRLLRIAIAVEIQEVKDFVDTGVEPKFTNVVEIPKTEASYFKRMYRNHNDSCIDMFMTNEDGTEIMIRLDKFRETSKYIQANDKSFAEALWIWSELTSEIKDTVKLKFTEHKNEMILKSRT